MRKGTLALALLAFAFLLSPAALADTLSVTLAKPTQSGAPGTTFSFTATLTAAGTNSGNIYLNGDAFTLPGLGRTLDDTGFFANFPLFLTPGQSLTNVLFTISTLTSSPAGPFTGFFSILGGSNASTYNTIATVNYTVNTVTVTPEPSSLLLLGTGATGALGLLRRRKALLRS